MFQDFESSDWAALNQGTEEEINASNNCSTINAESYIVVCTWASTVRTQIEIKFRNISAEIFAVWILLPEWSDFFSFY